MAWNLDEALQFYKSQGAPNDQSALKNLLKEIADENENVIPQYMIIKICEQYKIKESFLNAIIKRLPNVRTENNNILEFCMGENCNKNKKLFSLAQDLKDENNLNLDLKFVPCFHMCDRAPNIRFNGKIYSDADEKLIKFLLKNNL